MKQVYAKDMVKGRYYLIYGSTPKTNYPSNAKYLIHSKSLSIVRGVARDNIARIMYMEWNRMTDAIKFTPASRYELSSYEENMLRSYWMISRTPVADNCTRKVIFELTPEEALLHTDQL